MTPAQALLAFAKAALAELERPLSPPVTEYDREVHAARELLLAQGRTAIADAEAQGGA